MNNILYDVFLFWSGLGMMSVILDLSEGITINNKMFFRFFLYGPFGWLIILLMASCYIAGLIVGGTNFIIRKIFLDKGAE